MARSISGESADLRKEANLLDSLEKDLVGVYAAATRLPADRVAQLMADETWFDAAEALTVGLATQVVGKINGAIPAEYLAKFEHVSSHLVSGEQDSDNSIVPTRRWRCDFATEVQ